MKITKPAINLRERLKQFINWEQVVDKLSQNGITLGDTINIPGELHTGDVVTQQASVANNIVARDVFVYDTSMDSDAGAWRQRTTHTSWYGETLNTPDRGSRRDFPGVAVLVTEADKMTIYDADDPTLPMWMVFRAGSGKFVASGGEGLSSLTRARMLNGLLVTGAEDILSGNHNPYSSEINFISERTIIRGRAAYYTVNNIISRNIGSDYGGDGSIWRYFDQAGQKLDDKTNPGPNCCDIDMRVYNDCVIDPATGLPVPYIAYATEYGVKLVKYFNKPLNTSNNPGCHVIHITSSQANYTRAGCVKLLPNKQMATGFDYIGSGYDYNGDFYHKKGWFTNGRRYGVCDIPPTSTVLTGSSIRWDGEFYKDFHPHGESPLTSSNNNEGDLFISTAGWFGQYNDDPTPVIYVDYNATRNIDADGTHLAFANRDSLTIVDRDTTNPKQGMICHIGDDFNSGWQQGDCLLAAGDANTTATLGVDETVILTPAFNSSEWELTGNWTVVDYAATSVAGDPNHAVLNDILQVGEYYQVEIRVTGDAVTVPAGVGIFPVGLTLAEGVHKFNGKAVSTGVRLDANGDSTVHYFVRPTSNFLVNPNFNGGATGKFWGWIDQSFGTQTIDDTNNSINGQLTMTRTANDSEAIGQAVTVKANTDYVFTWRADNVTGAGYAQIYIGTTQNGYQLYQGLRDTSVEPGDWSTRSTTFNTGDTTTIYITVRTGNDVTFDLTHLSLRQAVVNRSKYSYTAGLQVHGQVRQEPVVTGSNLTCYTGFRDGFDSLFGSANGLVLPNLRNTHNNDFYVSCWIQGGSSAQVIMCYEHEAADSGGSWLLFQNSGRFHIYLRNNDTSVLNGEWKSWSSTDYGGSIYDSANLDAWNHLVYTRSGDSIKLYVNGILDIAADNIENFDIINHDSKICIGRRGGEFALDQKFAGKIALPKYGTHTIPQDKVYKMYSDEREMFYPNASVTIGSTPVYDVSYNEHDESLNVVTQNSTDKLQNLVVVSTTKTTGQKQINSQAEHTITG